MTAGHDPAGATRSRGIRTETPAQRRIVESVLDWGGERPRVDPHAGRSLSAALDAGLEPMRSALRSLASRRRRRAVVLSSWVRARNVCDGWQLEPEVFTPDRAAARGLLTRKALLAAIGGGAPQDAGRLVEGVWHQVASRDAGDPSSLSAWLNALDRSQRQSLREEVADLLRMFREVWPTLPAEHVRVSTDETADVPLLGGIVRLKGRVDIRLESRHTDDRARGLVVSLKSGMPQPTRDRDEGRAAALLSTLTQGRPPFRWVTYHVTEGRAEVEDLTPAALSSAVEQIIETASQLLRIAELEPGAPESALRLRGGRWCGSCRRRVACSRAAVTPDE